MTGSADHTELTDARLVAYLDGVLEDDERIELALDLANKPELAQRLALLEAGGRDFKSAYGPLLDAAPDAALQDMLTGLIAQTDPQQSDNITGDNVVPLPLKRRSIWSSMAGMAAAAGITLAVFSGGVYTGWQTGATGTPQLDRNGPQKKIGWRQAAAQYIALYNKHTLAGLPTDHTMQEKGFVRISGALGRSFTRANTSIDELAFKGTQVLHLKGKPLVQIAYLHNDQTPVALCIIKTGKPSSGQKTEKRLGLNIVHWIKGGYGYMLIGKVPKGELEQIATPLAAQFS